MKLVFMSKIYSKFTFFPLIVNWLVFPNKKDTLIVKKTFKASNKGL